MTNTQNNADMPGNVEAEMDAEAVTYIDGAESGAFRNGYAMGWNKAKSQPSPVAEGDERQEMLERIRAIRTRNGPSVTSLLGDLEKLERVLSAPLPGDDLSDEFLAGMSRVIAIAKAYKADETAGGNYRGANESCRKAIEHAENLIAAVKTLRDGG